MFLWNEVVIKKYNRQIFIIMIGEVTKITQYVQNATNFSIKFASHMIHKMVSFKLFTYLE